MKLSEIIVLAWLFGKLPSKEIPAKKQKKKHAIDAEAAEQINWNIWFFLLAVFIIACVVLFATGHWFIAGCVGGIAIFALSFPFFSAY